MQARKSPLILEGAYIIASNILSVPQPADFIGLLNDYPIDIDFDIFVNQDDADARRVLVSMQGNDQENPVPGYCFSIVAQATFNYEQNSKITKEEKDILLTRSAIPIVIGHIRSYLSTLTAHGPYGIYLLPVVDMNDLLAKKSGDKA